MNININTKVTSVTKRKMIQWMKDFSILNEVDYERWYVGISNDVAIRIKAHIKNKKISTLFFNNWYVYSKANAHEIEKWFSKEKNTINAPTIGGANEKSKYVYCFKGKPHLIDEIVNLLSK